MNKRSNYNRSKKSKGGGNNSTDIKRENKKRIEYLKSVALQKHNELSEKWEYVTAIEDYVKNKIRNVSFSQVRNLFNIIRKINDVRELPDIDYRLKYIAGKSETDLGLKFLLQDLIVPLIKKVNTEQQLKHYQEFLTALLCYHKFYANKK